MSLEYIQLPPFLIQDLFKKMLIVDDTHSANKQSIDAVAFLGNNKRNILVITENNTSEILDGTSLTFLSGILKACKLSIQDVALINIYNKSFGYDYLQEQFKAEKILMLGPGPERISLPLQFPYYQMQYFQDNKYLTAPALAVIAADKEVKQNLWAGLQKIFDL
ncbi:MAG: hypothetical protein ABIO05_07070 [Ferruginibacter sp.]